MVFARPPGVYFERTDAPSGYVEETRTDITGFVGVTERGPLHRPLPVHSWTQFQSRYGRDQLPYAYLPDCVRGFFANGGKTAWIVRVGNPDAQSHRPSTFLVNSKNQKIYELRARDPGLSGGLISIRIVPIDANRFHLFIEFDGETMEVWRDVACDPDASRSLFKLLNGRETGNGSVKRSQQNSYAGSSLIEAEFAHDLNAIIDHRVVGMGGHETYTDSSRVENSRHLTWPTAESSRSARSVLDGFNPIHFVGVVGDDNKRWGLAALAEIDEPSIVAMPDLMWYSPIKTKNVAVRNKCASAKQESNTSQDVETRVEFDIDQQRDTQFELLNHCMQLKDRFAVLDCPNNLSPQQAVSWSEKLQSFAGQYAALYYPWIAVPSTTASHRWLPSSGHVAGLYARVDLEQGVHKSPANEILSEALGTRTSVSVDDHGWLNQSGVNVIQPTTARGVRVLGARTLIDLVTSGQRSYQFISVRRLVMMIEESLEQNSQWLVHVENSIQTRIDLERVVRNFLMRQWRLARLDGESPEEAFRIVCDESNNPTDVVDQSRLICDIAIKPPPPAEFVLIRIGGQDSSFSLGNFGGQHV